MAVDEHDELPKATQREAELQRQIDDLQASHKKRRFRTQVCPMPPLETPNSGVGAGLPTAAPGGEASAREKAKDAQTYEREDSDSELEPDKEALDGAARGSLLRSLIFTRCSPIGSMPCNP
ncbi:hypothetical protein DY000_02050129 [Brassica cretica]|uniref:Uncharacterized protein n=1 Tax=Brassica cretica TaxID=69181 RepID=A0ABQ7EQI3_BRACR|nr:hypothetical protein DY000_02050129 [Brassica cretica]